MSNDTLTKKKEEKFFFNMHVFDDAEYEEWIRSQAPEKTYTQEEFDSTKSAAYEQGYKEGHEKATQELKASRAELTTKVLQKISEDTSTLFAQEIQRADIYEREAIELSLRIFEELFPIYKENVGFGELSDSIKKTLQDQKNQAEILIRVHPENVAGVEKLLTEINNQNTNTALSVQADESLTEQACQMRWNDGGASRNPDALAGEIKALLQQMLAGTAAKGHDIEEAQVSPEAAPAEAQKQVEIESSEPENTDTQSEAQVEEQDAPAPVEETPSEDTVETAEGATEEETAEAATDERTSGSDESVTNETTEVEDETKTDQTGESE